MGEFETASYYSGTDLREEGDNLDPEIEILTVIATLTMLHEILIGGGDNPFVCPHGTAGPNPLDDFFSRTHSSAAWVKTDRSPISSRKIVLVLAFSKRPGLSL